MDETCLSDIEYCKSREYWYCVAKTLAEMEALEFTRRTGLKLTTICQSIATDTMLQPTFNSISLYLLEIKKGNNPVECIGTCFEDLHDSTEAILLVDESPEAEGRYICSAFEILMQKLVNLLKEIYLEYDYRKMWAI